MQDWCALKIRCSLNHPDLSSTLGLALQNAATTKVRNWRNTGKSPSKSPQDGSFVLKEPNLKILWFSSFHLFNFILLFLPSDTLSKNGTKNDTEFAGTLCCLQQKSVSHVSMLEKQGPLAWASPVQISIGQEEITNNKECCFSWIFKDRENTSASLSNLFSK